jgi:hypothetical protein
MTKNVYEKETTFLKLLIAHSTLYRTYSKQTMILKVCCSISILLMSLEDITEMNDSIGPKQQSQHNTLETTN